MTNLRTVARVGSMLLLLGLMAPPVRSQVAPAPAPPPTAPPADSLGRDTPRGTVRGFLRAARADNDLARQYLDTPLSAGAAATLARQLFVVLDARLPARLSEVSDLPEGSRANPLRPDQELVGTIPGDDGDVEILVERVTRGGEQVWLFSQATLRAVPILHAEITLGWGDGALPRFLTGTRLGGIRVFEWMAALIGLPMFYLLTLLLNRLLTPLIRAVSRRFLHSTTVFNRQVLPIPVRILILAFATRWFGASLPLPLLVRQFWSNLATLLAIVGLVWLAILVNGEVEQYIRRRIAPANLSAGTSLARLARRVVDLIVLLVGLLSLLRHFGVDPTPALAGLGVGGIAVALAAQKTLENVVAGASLIFDQAVQVGDSLKVGDVIGTVDQIGLRSTRIRTLDRTVVSIPNSQIANATSKRCLRGTGSGSIPWSACGTRRRQPVARGARGHPPIAPRRPIGRRRIGASPFPAPRRVLARHRRVRVCQGARLEPLSRDPGTAALRRDRCGGFNRRRDRVSLADDVRGKRSRCRAAALNAQPLRSGCAMGQEPLR